MPKTVLDLSNPNAALKPLPPEILDGFIRNAIVNSALSFDVNYSVVNNLSTANVFCSTRENAEQCLSKMNDYSVKNLADYVEKTTGEPATKYNRSILLFESAVNDGGVLTLTWRRK
jgi:hypothetical protein